MHAVVIIGRNEGERLRRCLESANEADVPIIYVDSGSSDGSVDLAKSFGVETVELDQAVPFTAARARNVGWRRIRELAPQATCVQFVDGDCELIPGWVVGAESHLLANPRVAAVGGRLRERHPEHSIYNRLCDMEWDTPSGETKALGGIAMYRMEALAEVSGFRDELIAGEEPELCVRLRAAGWKIVRLPIDMAWHDAAMLRFGQWWRRSIRTGFAYAEGVRLHGGFPERHWVRESASALLWGAVIPSAVLASAWAWSPWTAALLSVYPLQVLRLASRYDGIGRVRWARAFFFVAGKFPETLGQLKAWLLRLRRRPAVLIEYK